jgi:hypothetical protein
MSMSMRGEAGLNRRERRERRARRFCDGEPVGVAGGGQGGGACYVFG